MDHRTSFDSRLQMPSLTPWAKRLLILNFGIWVATLLLWLGSGPTKELFFVVLRRVGVTPDLLFHEPWFAFWQPLTYQFFHSVDPRHLLFNSISIFFFGTLYESTRGSREFLGVYLIGGVVGGLAYALIDGLVLGSQGFCIGASGACYSVLVAAAVLMPNTEVIVLFVSVPLWILATILVGLNAVDLLLALDAGGGGGGTALTAHLGGAAYGFLAVRYPVLVRAPVDFFADWRERREAGRRGRQEQEFRDRRAEVDRLLEKVGREGIGSLTRSERTFLERASKDYRSRD